MLGFLKNEDVVSELFEVIATYEQLNEVNVTKESSLAVNKEPFENITEQPLIMRDVNKSLRSQEHPKKLELMHRLENMT